MKPALNDAIALLLAFGCAAAHGEVYKCTSPAGAIAYQDHECAQGDTQTVVRVHTPPPDSAEAAPPSGDVTGAAPPPPPVPVPLPSDAAAPHARPPMWVCTRPEDGSQYISHDGNPPVRMVPAGVMGVPGKSLGEAYGKNGGVSVSAPGLRKTPISTAPQDAIAGDYVAVHDQCEPPPTENACAFLQSEYDRLHKQWLHAVKAEEDALRIQLDELNLQLDGC